MHRPLIHGTCLVLLWAGWLCAQVAPVSPPSQAASEPGESKSAAPSLREVQPPLYYLPDKNGVLQPAPGFTLEEFLEAYNHIHGLAAGTKAPSYVLEKAEIVGSVEQGHAKLTLTCQVLFQRKGIVRVPLALGRVILDGPAKYDGQGQPVVAFQEKQGGYAVWLEGEKGKQHQLTMTVLAPLASVGGKDVLRLRVPSATKSELRLGVPMADIAAEASEGALLKMKPGSKKGGTDLIVRGLRGDFELAWHKPEVRSSTTPTVLEATGEIAARIDDRGVHCDATLRIKGHGRAFDHFRVRLPVGAELLSSGGSSQRVTTKQVEPTGAKEGPLVEVQLHEKTMGPITVHLATRRTLDRSLFGRWIELAGFTVVGAARQSGHIALEAADDLEVLFDPQWGVRQDDALPDSLDQEGLLAGFEYTTAPCSLLARIGPSRTRMSIEPQYVAKVGADQVRLDGVLDYAVRGKKAQVLNLDLAGWEYDEIGPDNLVEVDKVMEAESGILSIPLLRPSSNSIRLKLRAHRKIRPADKEVCLRFPRPLGATMSPAAVVIVPEDNVQLTVDSEATQGLLRQQGLPPMKLPRRQQTPLFYRGDPESAVFVAEREIHDQEITVRSVARVTIDSEGGQVRQKLIYKIGYEPQDVLNLQVRRDLIDSDAFEFRVNGHLVSPADIARSMTSDSGGGETLAQLQITLGKARIGMCHLEARYSLASHHLAPRSSVKYPIPLVVPLDGTPVGNRMTVSCPPQVEMTMSNGPWRKQTNSTSAPSVTVSAGQSAMEFASDGRVAEAMMLLRLESREMTHATVVHRALVQTRLAHGFREDRAVFNFTTHERKLFLVLPNHTSLGETQLLLDGRQVPFRQVGEQVLRLDLPGGGAGRPSLLEVYCQNPASGLLRGRNTLELPRLGENTWVRRLYWQLTLPENEHVINAPAGLVREFRWGWNGVFCGREPLLHTADLEAWVGLPDEGESAGGDDSYLFSTFGRSHTFTVVVASRSWIVLGASGVALMLGLLVIYVPASRRPAGLLALAVVLGISAFVYPEPTLLVLQAAGVGLVLALIAGILERRLGRRRRRLVCLESSGSSIAKDSTQTQFLVAGVNHGGSTTTPLQQTPPGEKASSSVHQPDTGVE